MTKVRLSTLIIISLILVSCSYNPSLVKSSYNLLSVSQTSYDTAMKSAVNLKNQNLISEKDFNKILDYATTYHQAHNSAVDALLRYKETKSLKDKQLLEEQISATSSTLTNLLTILKPHLED